MDYPSNSHKQKDEASKDEPKKLDKIITGKAVTRKKSLGKRFKEVFTGGDGRSVMSYVFMDVLIPALKDMIADAGTQGLERMLFGDATPRRRPHSRSGSPNGYVAYNRYSRPTFDARDREEPRRISRQARASHNFDEIILESRGEAEQILDTLTELISKYGQASVSELYELTGIEGNYTDDKWGWYDLRGASAQRLRQGYLLNLPAPEYLKD